jgi:mRNA interferase RelE/StbE
LVSWEVVWSKRAADELRALDSVAARRIGQAVTRLAETGLGDVKRLRGSHEYRLRVGGWRVRFLYHYDSRSLEVLRVVPRGRAYRD